MEKRIASHHSTSLLPLHQSHRGEYEQTYTLQRSQNVCSSSPSPNNSIIATPADGLAKDPTFMFNSVVSASVFSVDVLYSHPSARSCHAYSPVDSKSGALIGGRVVQY